MKKIVLKPLQHRNEAQIGIYFTYDDVVKDYIKQFAGVKWSQMHRVFYVKDSSENRQRLFEYLRAEKFYVDYNGLKRQPYFEKKAPKKTPKNDKEILYKQLPVEHKSILKRYINFLRGKRLSESTVSTYGYFVLRFIDFAKDSAPSTWSNETIHLFLEQVITAEHYSISSHRQCIGGLNYLTELCGFEGFDASTLKRPKKNKFLPVVLSKEEIIDLLQATKNLKHRAILGLIYSSGLRIGELINLELKDIDVDRNQIHIKNSKGRKDRVVVLSEVIKPMLLNYMQTYQPKVYFAEGQHGGRYTPSSVRSFLKASCKAAGIKKQVTPHTLRHSFATHMMENGVDLRYIQELLGHAKPETTMVYTHVAQKDLMKVVSPLDVTVTSLTKSGNEAQKVLLSRSFK